MIVFLKHVDSEGPGTWQEFLSYKSPMNYRIVELHKGDSLPPLDKCEAVISLGGTMNVYEVAKYPFLEYEEEVLKKALKVNIPILGICLGAQILAKVCGSRITRAKIKEMGWRKLRLTKAGSKDPLFMGLPAELDVFQWHQDTFEIPEGALHLAETKSCPNQAFRIGENAYGLQFHIEVTPAMIKSWIEAYAKNGYPGKKRRLEKDFEGCLKLEKEAEIVYSNFARIINNRKKRPWEFKF